jgi:hypothetical protein
MFVPQERFWKRPFGRAKQTHPPSRNTEVSPPVGEPPLLTFQDYTTAYNLVNGRINKRGL